MFTVMTTSISRKVAAWREASGFSQAGAANHLGVSPVVFHRIERGARLPAPDTAALFIKASVFSRDEWAIGWLEAAGVTQSDDTAPPVPGDARRTVTCSVCDLRLDDRTVRACQAEDCPQADREAA